MSEYGPCKVCGDHNHYGPCEPPGVAPSAERFKRRVEQVEGTLDVTVLASSSCDSPELAAIRDSALDPDDFDDPYQLVEARGHRRVLLRMVDELTATVEFKSETIYQQSMHITELQKERDELRAQLETAWAGIASNNVAHEEEKAELREKLAAFEETDRGSCQVIARQAKEIDELRAKLAEAEGNRDAASALAEGHSKRADEAERKLAFILPKYNAQATSHNEKQSALLERAEAAEARVREMSSGQWVGGKPVRIINPDEGWMTPNVKIPKPYGDENE